jgi:hypothetical protein
MINADGQEMKRIVPITHMDKTLYLIYDYDADQGDGDAEFFVRPTLESAIQFCEENNQYWEVDNG